MVAGELLPGAVIAVDVGGALTAGRQYIHLILINLGAQLGEDGGVAQNLGGFRQQQQFAHVEIELGFGLCARLRRRGANRGGAGDRHGFDGVAGFERESPQRLQQIEQQSVAVGVMGVERGVRPVA